MQTYMAVFNANEQDSFYSVKCTSYFVDFGMVNKRERTM